MFPTEKDFMEMGPEQLFLFLTGYMARTLASGSSLRMIDAVLSCFDEDARRALCTGTACARALGVDPEYRTALMHSMATVLYQTMKEKGGAQNAQG